MRRKVNARSSRPLLGTIPSPLGDISLIWDESGLHYAEFEDPGDRRSRALQVLEPRRDRDDLLSSSPYPEAFARYFAGDFDAFAELSLVLEGSDFQEAVWAALLAIPVGATRSYGELARGIGRAGAARAVGSANRRNPLGIIVPCHRVIGADGGLAGYGGRKDRKHWLLRHEGALPADGAASSRHQRARRSSP